MQKIKMIRMNKTKLDDENRPAYYDGYFKIKTKTKSQERRPALFNEHVKTNIDRERERVQKPIY